MVDIKNDLVDDMKWSFSRLSSFHTCKKMWYLTYIEGKNSEDNFFSEYGTFAHSIFEKYAKNEIELYEIPEFIKNNYNNFINTAPPPNKYVDLNETYYNKLIKYFDNFNGFSDETIGVEQEVSFDITVNKVKRKFTGYIDRVSLDKNNNIVITDYKSKAKFKDRDELEKYSYQPYLYSIWIKNKYGVYPKFLDFNMFRSGIIERIEFNIDDLKKAKKWASDTIKSIYKEDKFDYNYNEFFCKYLCGCSKYCPKVNGD